MTAGSREEQIRALIGQLQLSSEEDFKSALTELAAEAVRKIAGQPTAQALFRAVSEVSAASRPRVDAEPPEPARRARRPMMLEHVLYVAAAVEAGMEFARATKERADEVRKFEQTVRAACTRDLGIPVNDWHSFHRGSQAARDRLYRAANERYPGFTAELKQAFGIER